jgi:NADH-quinone oxidoreductase subunit K
VIPASAFFLLAVVLFVLGVLAFFLKRDLVTQFLAVEVMLNAANLAFLALAKASMKTEAQVMIIFILTVAAAEAVVGMAIVLLVFRRKKTIRTEDMSGLKG